MFLEPLAQQLHTTNHPQHTPPHSRLSPKRHLNPLANPNKDSMAGPEDAFGLGRSGQQKGTRQGQARRTYVRTYFFFCLLVLPAGSCEGALRLPGCAVAGGGAALPLAGAALAEEPVESLSSRPPPTSGNLDRHISQVVLPKGLANVHVGQATLGRSGAAMTGVDSGVGAITGSARQGQSGLARHAGRGRVE